MKLSIITINYNNRNGLQKTINSVVNQTWHEFEWIVIDGGSTDGSKELIEKYQEHISYWCSEPDKGIYNAMNKGIAKAEGDYLLFINSGDNLYNERVLEDVFPYLKEDDFISGDTVIAHKNGINSYWHSPRHFTIYAIVNYPISHPSTFISKRLLKERPYREDLRIVSDWEQMLYELVFRDATYHYLPYMVSVFHEDGISHTNAELAREERQEVLQSVFSKRLHNAILGDNEMKAIVNHIEYGTFQYKLCLFAIKVIRKLTN